MATITFSTLPAEIHVSIAKYCKNNDLINLCLTSKLVNERCWHVLYREVDLQFNRHSLGALNIKETPLVLDSRLQRQLRFVHTLLSHPEYGKHVRIFKGKLCIPTFNECLRLGELKISEEEWSRAMQTLTNVQSVDLVGKAVFAYGIRWPATQFPNDLFQTATSVRLGGHMKYGLAKSILNAINPATLKHLCLDFVQDRTGGNPGQFVPGQNGEDGRIIAFGVISGLLTTLTGRCTALRTLILRRIGQIQYGIGLRAAAEDAADEISYTEWASFIRSVQGTVEKFTFEQVVGSPQPPHFINERFQRLILSTIVSGNWPCLKTMELRGIGHLNLHGGLASSDGQGGLATELKAVFGGNAMVVVKEKAGTVDDFLEPYRWN